MKNYFLLLTVLMPLVIASKCTEDSLSKIPTKDFIIDFDGVQVEETLKFLDDAEGNRDRLYVSNNNKTSSSDKSFTSISISAYQDYDSAEVTLQTYKSIYTSDYYCTRAGEMESCYTRAELSSTDVLSRIILAQKDEMSATYLSSIGNAVEYQVQWSNDEYTEINGQATWFRGVNIYEFYSSLSSSGVFSFYLVLP